MEALLVLLVLGIFLGPFILIAALWSKVNRLELQNERTTGWLQQQLDGVRERMAETAVADMPSTDIDATEQEPVPDEEIAPEPEIAPLVESQLDTPGKTGVTSPAPPIAGDEESTSTFPPTVEQETELTSEPATVAYASADAEAVSQEPHGHPEPEYAKVEPSRTFDFEDIFGRRLPIWAGGIALAISGIFLVRYSIEAGLLTPLVRVALSFVFGFGLIAGAEATYRFEDRVKDERVRQALAGAGIATLFGAFYLAGANYGLIGAGAAFMGLAAVTAGAIALSFRFGLPCAMLGLLGGFAAPVLVESDGANVPLLALYLALVTGGLAWTGVQQGHRWLGYTALAVGLGWGLLMQLGGLDSSGDLAALGLYLVVLGTVLPAMLAMRGTPSIPQLATAGVATLQMAVLVGNAGFEPLTWGLYLLIGAALTAMGWRYPSLRTASAMAAFIGLWLLGLWSGPSAPFYALIAAMMALIFAGMPLFHQLRGEAGFIERAQIALVALGIGAASYFHFGDWSTVGGPFALAAGMAGLALLPIAAFASRWNNNSELEMRNDLLLLGSTHPLLFVALVMLVPASAAPLMAVALALPVLALLWKRSDDVLLAAGWIAIAIALVTLAVTPSFENEAMRLGGEGDKTASFTSLLRWIVCCSPLVVLGAIRPTGTSRPIADVLAAGLAYGAAAQIVPGQALAWLAAIASLAVFVWRYGRGGVWGALLTIAGLWAIAPVMSWLGAGIMALAGQPFLVTETIAPLDVALRIAPFALVAVITGQRAKTVPAGLPEVLFALSTTLAVISLHSLYKLAWNITSLLRHEWYGMGERTLWIAALVAAAFGASRFVQAAWSTHLRLALLLAALIHFAWFTLILHNPLFTVQHVGPTPIANWLSAAYGVAIAALILLRDEAQRLHSRGSLAVDVILMGLISLLAVSLLRQMFAGSVLTSTGIGQTESLLLSLLGIALALGFLWWGSRVDQRVWRIGSLVLMLVAVLKVFLIDAAGLDGLLRIASFMALGFSLIGIGWVYSRQLRRTRPEAELTARVSQTPP